LAWGVDGVDDDFIFPPDTGVIARSHPWTEEESWELAQMLAFGTPSVKNVCHGGSQTTSLPLVFIPPIPLHTPPPPRATLLFSTVVPILWTGPAPSSSPPSVEPDACGRLTVRLSLSVVLWPPQDVVGWRNRAQQQKGGMFEIIASPIPSNMDGSCDSPLPLAGDGVGEPVILAGALGDMGISQGSIRLLLPRSVMAERFSADADARLSIHVIGREGGLEVQRQPKEEGSKVPIVAKEMPSGESAATPIERRDPNPSVTAHHQFESCPSFFLGGHSHKPNAARPAESGAQGMASNSVYVTCADVNAAVKMIGSLRTRLPTAREVRRLDAMEAAAVVAAARKSRQGQRSAHVRRKKARAAASTTCILFLPDSTVNGCCIV
jgi:hypothetical protein